MKFTGSGQTLYVYPEQKKIFLNGEIFEMEDVAIFTPSKAKFSFSIYDVKLVGDRLSLFSKSSRGLVSSLNKEEEFSISSMSSNSETRFIISRDRYVTLISNSFVNYKEINYEIIKKFKTGTSDVYSTSIGDLVVSNSPNRKSSWLGIYIEMI